MTNKNKKTSVPWHHRDGKATNEWDKINEIKTNTNLLAATMSANALDVTKAVKTVVQEHIREPLTNVNESLLSGLIDSATTLADDLAKHQVAVLEVGKTHEGKEGGVRSDDQLVVAMNVAATYHNLTNDTIDIATDALGDLVVGLSQIVDDNKDRQIVSVVEEVNKVKTSLEAKRPDTKTGEQ